MSDPRQPLAGTNLNLFPVLAALLRRGSVSRAADDLHVSQSAVSHSLRELRAVFDDPLFVRNGQQMVPTARALALGPHIKKALETLDGAMRAAPTFDPATSRRAFSIATSDEVMISVLPALMRLLRVEAPGVQLSIRARIPGQDVERLHRGDIDFLFIPRLTGVSGLTVHELYSDDFSCVVRKNHPAVAGKLTLKTFLSLSHVLVTPDESGPGAVDDALARKGKARHVALTTRYFHGAPELVADSDYVLTLPTRLCHVVAARLPLDIYDVPLAIPGFSIYRVSSKFFDSDPAMAWFAERLAAVNLC